MYTADIYSVIGFDVWQRNGMTIALPRLAPRVRMVDGAGGYGPVEVGLLVNPTPGAGGPRIIDCSRRWLSWSLDQLRELVASAGSVTPVRVIDQFAARRVIPRRASLVTALPDGVLLLQAQRELPSKGAHLLSAIDGAIAEKYGIDASVRTVHGQDGAPQTVRGEIVVTNDALASLVVGVPEAPVGAEENPNILTYLAALERGEVIERQRPARSLPQVDAELGSELGIDYGAYGADEAPF